LDTFNYQPKEQELCVGLDCSAVHGAAGLVSILLQWSCKEQHRRCRVCDAVREALSSAAKGGHVGVVSLLLNHPSCTAQAVRDAVCKAVRNKQLEVLRMLVSSRPDAGSPMLKGSPMQAATSCGYIAAMEVLVQHGADVNGSKGSPWQCDEDVFPAWRPICLTVMHGQIAAVAWLLQQGITGEDCGLGQALDAAAYSADAALMHMLLSHSPAQAFIPSHGASALLIAVQLGHIAVAEELLKAGVPSSVQAIQHAWGCDSEGSVRTLLRKRLLTDHEQAAALLQAAIQNGHPEFAQLLREAMDWGEPLD
jgi:hypothetical protein